MSNPAGPEIGLPPFSLATTTPNRKKPRPLVGAFSFLTWAAGSFPGTAEAVSLKRGGSHKDGGTPPKGLQDS